MYTKILVLTVSFFLFGMLTTRAHAGDPCPVAITVAELGVPEWLDQDEVLSTLADQESFFGITSSGGRNDRGFTGNIVSYVFPNSSADKAGIEVDDVIWSINGVTPYSYDWFKETLDALKPGDQVDVTYLREEVENHISIDLGRRDPLGPQIIDALNKRDCLSADKPIEVITPQERNDIMSSMFSEDRSFRCFDSHLSLRDVAWDEVTNQFVEELYIVRGSQRVLIAMPNWASRCYQATELDDLSDAALAVIIEDLLENYIGYGKQL